MRRVNRKPKLRLALKAISIKPKQPRGFRVFVIKNELVFTIVGAIIVLVAFFMKEAIREGNKDTATIIKDAKSSAALQDRLGDISVNLRQIFLNQTHEEQSAYNTQTFNELIKDQRDLFMDSYNDQEVLLTNYKNYLTSITFLTKALPASSPRLSNSQRTAEKELEHFDRSLTTALTEWDREKEKFLWIKGYAPTSEEIRRDSEVSEAAFARLTVSAEAAGSTESALEAFRDLVYREAEHQQMKHEARIREATYASYGLFVFGWILGLFGKLVKAPGIAGGVE